MQVSHNGLLVATDELTSLVRELAEVEVAETQAKLEGYIHSRESSNAGRERDGDANARDLTAERTRLRARVKIAELERETILALLLSSQPPSPFSSLVV